MLCENCGKEHDGSYGSGRFCCKECAKSFSTKKENKSALKEAQCIDCGKTIYINKRRSLKTCRCEKCLAIHLGKTNCKIFKNIDCDTCYFRINGVCTNKGSMYYKFKTLEKYCNLDLINADYNLVLDNYLCIKNNMQELLDNGYSSNEICEKLFGNSKRGNTIFSILQCKTRTLSESISNAFLQGKLKINDGLPRFHKEWHTTWEGKDYYLRSSYESEYANYSDENKIKYEVESLRIKYYDTVFKEYRCAIPDFYLPETNTIVEIKSTWTLNIQNMKDKVFAYKELGYNFKLILNHQETNLDIL